MQASYASVQRAWASKFLSSYAMAPLATRTAGIFATRFSVQNLAVQNRSGSAAVVGWGGRLPADATLWKAGQWTNATTTFTDDTADAQSSAATDVPLTTTTNNDGFIVMAQVPFNILSIIVSATVATGAPVYDVAYSIAGGTWTTLTLANLLVAPAYAAAGESLLWFESPGDWAVSEAGHATGIPTGYYAIRVRATTAPTIAPIATQIIPGIIVDSMKAVADSGVASWNYASGERDLPAVCDALAVAISGASDQNHVTAAYRMRG
ncbi:MAG: hypothetical protein KGP14_12015 [Betaproteobacteria bacterium]|nr:hypothetical protein [Betaproteobacteria bacterium]